MQFITDIIVAGLMAYLSFTNFLADKIIVLFPTESVEEIESFDEAQNQQVDVGASESGLIGEISRITTIPDILRTSQSFQQAAAVAGLSPSRYVSNPTDALVNIFCTSISGNRIRTTTGTGFFIHDKGVILTNAHVAQYLLLQNTDIFGDTSCTIRTGDPAAPQYLADLLYLPPSWMVAHAASVFEEAPTGTGERDYALLYVSKRVDGETLPDSFPALRTNTNLVPRTFANTAVIAAGYPAETMLRRGGTTDLRPRQAETVVTELYTFGSNYADVFSIRGSNVGEHGSSGGPITTSAGVVMGMIATRGNDDVDGAGSLRAITLSHIERTIGEETGHSLERNMAGNLPERSQVFNETMAPLMTQLITLYAPSI